MVRDLDLPKVSAVLLGFRLKSRNMLDSEVTFSWYKHREKEYLPFFTKEDDLVYCVDIKGLIEKLGTTYEPSDWRLFIDSSKRSLKAVLLHNGNTFASIPLAHSIHMKESYENMEIWLSKWKYHDHAWKVCVDTKVLNKLDIPSFLVCYANGIAKIKRITGSNVNSQQGYQEHLIKRI